MDQIQVKVLNPEVINDTIKYLAMGARITQHAHEISSMDDFEKLLNKPISNSLLCTLVKLPHPTIQKFTTINVVVVGGSRRFLAQITRHQNEVKFMSGSLQYSDYSGRIQPVVPYDLIDKPAEKEKYIMAVNNSLDTYNDIAKEAGNDAAGYISPNGMRNVLFISATPYQWKHMISQRVCRRNTLETRYIMLKIWEQLYKLHPILFAPNVTGPMCIQDKCKEGKMCCGCPFDDIDTPGYILDTDFPKLSR